LKKNIVFLLKPASVTEPPASVPVFTKQHFKSFESFHAANYAVIFKRKNDCENCAFEHHGRGVCGLGSVSSKNTIL
jgi:hypothetical protein